MQLREFACCVSEDGPRPRRRARTHDAVVATSMHRLIDAPTVDRWCAEYHRTGDERLRARIVEAHQWLVNICAKRLKRRRETIDDLVQVGNIGLLHAVDRFDPRFGVSFHTYASATITGELRRHYRSVWAVHVPRGLQERHLASQGAVDVLSARLRRSPTATDVAEHLGLSLQEAVEALAIGAEGSVVSLSQLADLGRHDAEPVAPDVCTDDRLAVAALLDRLPDLERTVIVLWQFHDIRQEEIGRRLGINQVQVSRVVKRAMNQLRTMVDDERHDAGTGVPAAASSGRLRSTGR
ncbi:MAG: polymerase, sigma 28 subunit, Sig subfamily [Ilumatobacteraceae bacterium]|nr:polymerase, sigma 28 subunit, Sig subfamily [Ilumatobacteraceae bacterium]